MTYAEVSTALLGILESTTVHKISGIVLQGAIPPTAVLKFKYEMAIRPSNPVHHDESRTVSQRIDVNAPRDSPQDPARARSDVQRLT